MAEESRAADRWTRLELECQEPRLDLPRTRTHRRSAEGDNEASMYLDEAALKNGAGINGALLRGALPGGGG